MDEKQITATLVGTLHLKTNTHDVLGNREGTQIEFKETFNLGSSGKYARTLAAFANAEGGYIVFGVKPSPHKAIGVNERNFTATDSAKITEILNGHFSPEIEWAMDTFSINGILLGYIYVAEARDKPVIAIKTSGNDVKEGEVYYRYRGRTSTIHYPEMRALIERRIDKERKAWLQHLDVIKKAGATNVAVIDTIQGKVFSSGSQFMIDEKLLRQIKFVKEGSFSEKDGGPALKLIGSLQGVSGSITEKIVHRGIHFDDLVTAFLAERELDVADAISYLKEACHQTSPFTPIYYFINKGKLSKEQAIKICEQETLSNRYTRNSLISRIKSTVVIHAVGIIGEKIQIGNITDDIIEQKLKEINDPKALRTLLFYILKEKPTSAQKNINNIQHIKLFEAITHLSHKDIVSNKQVLFDILLSIFTTKFVSLTSVERTYFRKTLAFIDESIYKNE